MQQTDFLSNITLDTSKQISPQLAQQNTPLFLNPTDNLEQRKKLITLYLAYHTMITTLGEQEHSSDWDPALTVTLNNGETIGDEPGFDIAQISEYNLLLEYPNDEDEEWYHTIPIMEIQSLAFHYH